MKDFIIILIYISITFSLLSCSKKGSDKQEIIEKQNYTKSAQIPTKITTEDFINYYVEVAKLQERYSDDSDSLSLRLKELHKQLGISETDIKQFREEHFDNAKKWQLIWKEIETKINNEKPTGISNKDL